MLFCNIDLLDEGFALPRGQYVGVRDGRIAYIGDAAPAEDFGERYDGRHRLLLPGFFNVHSHAPKWMPWAYHTPGPDQPREAIYSRGRTP